VLSPPLINETGATNLARRLPGRFCALSQGLNEWIDLFVSALSLRGVCALLPHHRSSPPGLHSRSIHVSTTSTLRQLHFDWYTLDGDFLSLSCVLALNSFWFSFNIGELVAMEFWGGQGYPGGNALGGWSLPCLVE